ncbi:MAG: hypothetical protein CL670_12290 [Balneola sp.]|jgi:hypothetical protein|nr:hypothetical protein [Balneola sp.]MBE79927.1 hypothetical protein [Balneola sp.]HBX67205.1 hypothetical protein [Balneolaceae bacterium]|tara:strand:- start:2541 stop:3212 length:672 start_codon:yes stop_codon:yes gene_type:complete
MRTITGLLLCFTFIFAGVNSSKAQTIELLAGNTLNGAVNGTILGGATMALNSNSDFAPLRVGVGLGTLYGIGTGAYDVATSGGQQLVVSGLFNDGNNTSIIVLLDTFYGAAAGAIITTSIMLIAEKPLVEGLQYGSAIGAWVGFGVGVIDAFALSERKTPSSAAASLATPSNSADGLVGIQFSEKTSIGLVSPSVIQTLRTNPTGLNTQINASVDLLNLKVNF